MEELLLEASKYFSVLCVTGPRQSGKSTILKNLFPNAVTYSLKDVKREIDYEIQNGLSEGILTTENINKFLQI